MARDKQDKYSFFDELRTVTRKSVFEIKSIYGVSALRDVTVGVITQADGEYQIPNAGNGDVRVLNTAQRCPYISGYVTEPGLGVRLPSRPTGETKIQFGPFGDDDGWFFEYNPTGLYGGVRRAGVDTLTLLSAWSENDTLFSNTRRAKEFDPTDGFIYQLPFSWYAFGPSQWEYQIRDLDPVNTMWLQELGESRPKGATSVTDPQQPIRVRVETGAGDPAYTLYVGGRQCSIVGDYSLSERETSIETTVASVSDSAWVPAFAIRRASITPYALTNLDSLSIRATGDIRVLIEQNGDAPTGTFVTPADYSANETLLEVNTAPGSTQGNGVSLQKLHVFTGTPSNPSGSQTPLERTPLIEQKNQIVYVRRFAGESAAISVDVLATFTEAF